MTETEDILALLVALYFLFKTGSVWYCIGYFLLTIIIIGMFRGICEWANEHKKEEPKRQRIAS